MNPYPIGHKGVKMDRKTLNNDLVDVCRKLDEIGLDKFTAVSNYYNMFSTMTDLYQAVLQTSNIALYGYETLSIVELNNALLVIDHLSYDLKQYYNFNYTAPVVCRLNFLNDLLNIAITKIENQDNK